MGPKIDRDADLLFREMSGKTTPPSSCQKQKTVPRNSLDLHGMYLETAQYRTLEFLQNSDPGTKQITIITGKGRNSPGAIPILKNGIEELLLANRSKLGYTYDYKNGVFTVWFD